MKKAPSLEQKKSLEEQETTPHVEWMVEISLARSLVEISLAWVSAASWLVSPSSDRLLFSRVCVCGCGVAIL